MPDGINKYPVVNAEDMLKGTNPWERIPGQVDQRTPGMGGIQTGVNQPGQSSASPYYPQRPGLNIGGPQAPGQPVAPVEQTPYPTQLPMKSEFAPKTPVETMGMPQPTMTASLPGAVVAEEPVVEEPIPTEGMAYPEPTLQVETEPTQPLSQDLGDYTLDPMTDVGKQYENYVEGILGGEISGEVQSAQNQADRNMAARDYYMMKQAKEAAAQAGYPPGTQQYEDMMKQARADVNNANLNEQNQVNQMRRDAFQDALNRASEIEKETYDRTFGERDFTFGRDDIQYLRNETHRIEDKTDAQRFINGIKDPKAKQFLNSILETEGHLGVRRIAEAIAKNNGEIPDEYKSMSPADINRKAAEEYVETLSENPQTLESWKPGEKEKYLDQVTMEMWQAEYAPVGEAGEQATEKILRDKRIKTFLDTGDFSGMADSDWEQMTPTQLKDAEEYAIDFETGGNLGDTWEYMENVSVADARSAWLARNPISAPENEGRLVKKGGKLYIITNPMATDKVGDNHRIAVKAVPVGGGDEIDLFRSSVFDEPLL